MSTITDAFWVVTTRDTDFPNIYSSDKIGEGLRLLVDEGVIITGMYQWIWNQVLNDYDIVMPSEQDD